MKWNSSLVTALSLGAITAVGMTSQAQPQSRAPSRSDSRSDPQGAITDPEAMALARDAYVYGYPLVTMEITRRQFTNVTKAGDQRAPMGQFANMRRYPSADFRGVTAPNADTLYSAAWLDVSKEPYVLEVPDVGERYYMMPILDAWTNVFADPGTRTTGTQAQRFLITGPGWSGTVPPGMTRYASPTALVWIIGRTYSTGTPQDYQHVHAIQDRYRLVPMSAYGPDKKYTPPPGTVDASIDMKTPPREQVNTMSGREYFRLLAELMKTNPPSKADMPMVARLAKLGIVPGKDFDTSKLDPRIVAAIESAPKEGLAVLEKNVDHLGKNENGWLVAKTGEYGTDYLFRATVTLVGLGANLAKDAVYPTAKTDMQGQLLDASKHDYVITFVNKDALPPVKGFWSITMYDDQFFFYRNPLNRQTLSQRSKLVANPDGSIELYLQHSSPGKDKEANWLPAPNGPFVVMMRLYWPTEVPPSILDGSWQPPGIKAVPRPPTSASASP